MIRPFKPCIFNLSTDLNETTDIAPQNPELLQTLWTALNNSWLGYYHARSPAHLVGPCNPSCTAAKWGAIGPGDGPECGVPGCDTPAPPGPPPPPPGPNPVPHKFPTVNSTNCTFVQGAHYVHRTPDHLHGPAGFVDTEEECCRLCFEDTCVWLVDTFVSHRCFATCAQLEIVILLKPKPCDSAGFGVKLFG